MDGQTEEDWNRLKLGFLKTGQPNSFSKLISGVCNFKNNAQETCLFVSNLWFNNNNDNIAQIHLVALSC